MCYGGEGQQRHIWDRNEFNESLLIYWSHKPIEGIRISDKKVAKVFKGDRNAVINRGTYKTRMYEFTYL